VRVTASFHALQRKGTACARVEGVFDPLADDVVLAVDAVQVDLMQDASAVACPRGDFGGLAGGGPDARAGGGEDDRSAAVCREDQVLSAQRDGFLRAQRRVVQAAEERGQFRPEAGDLGQDRPDLRRAGDRSRVDSRRNCGSVPAHQAEGIGGQQSGLDGVAEGAVERGPLAGDRVRRGG